MEGLGAEVDVIVHRVADAHAQARHLAGRTRFTPATLRYGARDSAELWDWLHAGLSGPLARRNMSVAMHREGGEKEFRWTLFDAWASASRALRLDAGGGAVAIGSLTLFCDRLARD